MDRWREDGYRVRLAREADLRWLPGIEAAAAAAFRTVGYEGDWIDEVGDVEEFAEAQQAGRLWVAADRDDVPVGFALARRLDGASHLEEIDVHPAHGRRGLGAALVAAVVAWARQQRAPCVTLSTFADVPWNAPFYTRLGFVVLPEDQAGPALRALRRSEAAQGLPVERRVLMRLRLDDAASD